MPINPAQALWSWGVPRLQVKCKATVASKNPNDLAPEKGSSRTRRIKNSSGSNNKNKNKATKPKSRKCKWAEGPLGRCLSWWVINLPSVRVRTSPCGFTPQPTWRWTRLGEGGSQLPLVIRWVIKWRRELDGMQFGKHLREFLVDDLLIFPLCSVFLRLSRAFQGPQNPSKEGCGSLSAPTFVATIRDALIWEGAQGTDPLHCILFGPNRQSPKSF